MLANVRPESLVFEFLDKLDLFVREHSLGFLVGIIVLTVFGGLWLLLRLRRYRRTDAGRTLTAGYGIGLSFPSKPREEEPPPLTDPKTPPSDDLRD